MEHRQKWSIKILTVLAQKRKRQIGGLTITERGTNVILVCDMSAAENCLVPAFIWAR